MIKPYIKAISYFSQDEYAAQAANLRMSCIKWSVEHEIVPKPPFQSWKHGVRHKPQFILDTMLAMAHTAFDGFLWLDADATIERKLPLDQLDGVQLGASYFQWSKGHPVELLTGTMYFSNEEKTRIFVEEWVRNTALVPFHQETPEQTGLLATLARGWGAQILFKDLGPEWTYIDDTMVKAMYPKANPIVKHHQFSRAFKEKERK